MLVTTERLVWVECVRSRIFRGSLQFAPGFCSSPLAASPSCAAPVTFFPSFVLSCLIRIPIRERPSQDRSAPSPVFNSGGMRKFREHRAQSFRFSQERVAWPYHSDMRALKQYGQPV